MGATFSRSRTFVAGETLTAVNLNAVETNILNNFTPAGMDDQSTDVTAMRVTVDPYPSSVASLATSLQGELERLRYILVQITGETYWYIDPDISLATLYSTYPTSATIQSGSVVYIADTGAADAYVATFVPAITAYTTGMEVNVKIVNANLTTTPTLNVNALGAKTIKRGNSAALLVGDLPANHQAKFRYNGTDMILLNPALHTHADAGQGGATLTSPTITTPTITVPTIADFTNATHTHAAAASGGLITGQVIQTVITQTGAVATGNTACALDDTIPQKTEGTEFMTRAITPTNASNILIITTTFVGSASAANDLIVALFQDTTASALAAVAVNVGINEITTITFAHRMVAGTTSSTTFKIRAAVQSTDVVTFNGVATARMLGGVMASSIRIDEIAV